MNAKEIKVDSHKILEENCHIEYDKAGELTVCSSLASVQIAMESYHQAKSKEEAEERYDLAIQWWNKNVIGTLQQTPKVMYGPNPELINAAIKLAAFGKEEEG